MTDEPKPPPNDKSFKPSGITVEELRTFMDRTDSATCPLCKNDSWTVRSPDAGMPAMVNLKLLENGTLPLNGISYFEVARVTCSKCGFVREHAMDVVLRVVRG